MCYTSESVISMHSGPYFRANPCPNSSFSQEVNVSCDTLSTSATPSVVVDLVWYLDNNAMTHITNNATHFNSSRAYQGSGNVFIGNGSSIPIS